MPDQPDPESSADRSDPGAKPAADRPPARPRWVKVFLIIAIVLLVAIVIGLLTGKLGPGGPHSPGRHMGARVDTTPTSVENASGIGEPADAGEADRTVEVATLDSMRLEPAVIKVSAGKTVTFRVTNTGQTVHEFTLGDASMQKEHAQAMAHMPAGVAHEFPNSIMLQPGETKQLTWRFGDASTLEYACHVQGHYEAGMRGQITTN